MDSDEVFKTIAEDGYCSLETLRSGYLKEDPEKFSAILAFLESRNRIRQVAYQSPSGPAVLYYVTPQD